MVSIITAIILLASVLLVFVVYIQNPKGGGLSSDFGAAQQIGGVQKTNDFIDKATWSLAAVIGVLSIFLTIRTSSTPTKAPDKDNTENTQGAPNGQNPNGNGGNQGGANQGQRPQQNR